MAWEALNLTIGLLHACMKSRSLGYESLQSRIRVIKYPFERIDEIPLEDRDRI